MGRGVNLKSIYAISDDVAAREIEGELIIIPITSGIADAEEELFTLNKTGKALWDKLDGKKSLDCIIKELSAKFDGPTEVIKKDVTGIIKELLKRKMLIAKKKNLSCQKRP